MAFESTHSKVDSIILLSLKGSIVAGGDSEKLSSLVGEFLEAGECHIILDLAQVNFIDSTGIGALIRVHSSAMRKGATVKLLRLTKRVYDVLQITRLSSVFEMYDDLEKAKASFGAASPGA
ncbi:MAG: STAS domain-containing protein [Terriglobia bacterium]